MTSERFFAVAEPTHADRGLQQLPYYVVTAMPPETCIPERPATRHTKASGDQGKPILIDRPTRRCQ